MKKMFLGCNTSDGFVSFYNKILPKGNRLFILKGGSGVGKHTFMKKIANHYKKLGYLIEYYHCSNDINSLDGIKIPLLNVAMIDGTSPHMVDPMLPGCIDEIIDLGVFIDNEKMETHKLEIKDLIKSKKDLYERAYKYLSAAKILHIDNCDLVESCIIQNKLNSILNNLPKSLLSPIDDNIGCVKDIFASSYTASGYIDYIDTLLKDVHTIGIKGYYHVNKKIMQSIKDYALTHGYEITVCHSPIDSSKIDHLIFNNKAILSIDDYNKYSDVDEMLCFKDIINKDKILDESERMSFNNTKIDELVNMATNCMSKSNEVHKKVEELYIPNMNFKGVDEIYNKIINKTNRYLVK